MLNLSDIASNLRAATKFVTVDFETIQYIVHNMYVYDPSLYQISHAKPQ
jgi:hypothetical protein